MRGFIVGMLILLASFSTGVLAKELESRLGVGYANQFGLNQDLPSVALRYYPNSQYGLMGALGVDTEKDASRFGFQMKILKLVFKEDNLNFYTGAGAGIISRELDGSTDSGFDLTGFVGAEFFFAGLENLGFNFEAGVGVTSVSSEVRFRTIGDHPLRAGLFFYF
ncbi:MAG: organic solvent tolerance protein [Bdellovibrionales bacterium]